MFNVKEIIREIEAEGRNEIETDPHAKGAKRAKNEGAISTISTLSTPHTLENENIGHPGQDNETPEEVSEPVPFTDHELAKHKINQLTLHDDRAFVRQMLLGTYGSDRLALVNQYFNEWCKGVDSEPVEVKKENAGRRRANIWLRENCKTKYIKFIKRKRL